MTSDWEALQHYAKEQADCAFATLVDRYFDMVWATALRVTRNEALANDVAQEVFTDLAKRAPGLGKNVVLRGWLYRATVFAAKNVNRREMRRSKREREAIAWHASSDAAVMNENDQQLLEDLDQGLQALSERDRNLILLRFFGKKRLGDIANETGASYEATQKQVARALARLKTWFARRGVVSTQATLMACLTAFGTQAAPSGLAAQVAQQSLAHAAATSSTWLTLLKLNTQLMTLKTPAVVTGITLASAVPLAFQEMDIRARAEELAETQARVLELDAVPDVHQEWLQAKRDFDTYQSLVADQQERDALNKELDSLKASGAEAMARRLNELRNLEAELDTQTQAWESAQAAHAFRQDGLIRAGVAKDLALPFIMFASDHENRFPHSLEDLRSHMEKELTTDADGNEYFLESPLDEWELFSPEGTRADYQAGSLILLREREPRFFDGKYHRVYAFGDGHSQIVARESLAEFDVFEAEQRERASLQ